MSTAKKLTPKKLNLPKPKPKKKVEAIVIKKEKLPEIEQTSDLEKTKATKRYSRFKPKKKSEAKPTGRKNNKALKEEKKKGSGRGNTKYDRAKVIQKLKEAYSIGCTDYEACCYADISTSTLYNIQNEIEEFLEEKQVYKAKPMLVTRKTIFENLRNIDIAQWYAEKTTSEFDYRRKNDGGSGDRENLSEERKAEIATALKNWEPNKDEDELDEDYDGEN